MSFFYTYIEVMKIKIYLDFLLFINMFFDFIILFLVSAILKRNVLILKLIISSFIGSLTIFLLFININSYLLIMLKLIISIIMILISFGFKNIKYFILNLYYFYIISITLGGFLYFFKLNIYDSFINIYNLLIIILFTLLFLIVYLKNIKSIKNNYNDYYKVKLNINNKEFDLSAFLDTGNKVNDPYNGYPVILINEKLVKEKNNYIYIPYKTISNDGLLKCIKSNKIIIDNKIINKKFLIGLVNITIDNVDVILNKKLMEDF